MGSALDENGRKDLKVRKSTHFDVVTFVSGQEDESEREKTGETWQMVC